MSDLADIVESMCIAVASGDAMRLHPLARVAGVKLGGDRGERIKRAFMKRPVEVLKHWTLVSEPRKPFIPHQVRRPIDNWLRELDHAEKLAMAGERVLPLLLSGETRCGKTSIASAIGNERRLPVYRLSLANAVDSHLGETAKAMERAFGETHGRAAVWLVDEIDAVAFHRRSGQAADQERAHAVGTLLTLIEALPPGMALIGTTNHEDNIDPAILGRFSRVTWPTWSELSEEQKREFLNTHGAPEVHELEPDSFASAVKMARAARVERVLGEKG